MTPKISLVAVCCSNAISLSSLNSRAFSIDDYRLIGERFKKLDLHKSEGTHLDATCTRHAYEFFLLT